MSLPIKSQDALTRVTYKTQRRGQSLSSSWTAAIHDLCSLTRLSLSTVVLYHLLYFCCFKWLSVLLWFNMARSRKLVAANDVCNCLADWAFQNIMCWALGSLNFSCMDWHYVNEAWMLWSAYVLPCTSFLSKFECGCIWIGSPCISLTANLCIRDQIHSLIFSSHLHGIKCESILIDKQFVGKQTKDSDIKLNDISGEWQWMRLAVFHWKCWIFPLGVHGVMGVGGEGYEWLLLVAVWGGDLKISRLWDGPFSYNMRTVFLVRLPSAGSGVSGRF